MLADGLEGRSEAGVPSGCSLVLSAVGEAAAVEDFPCPAASFPGAGTKSWKVPFSSSSLISV